MPSSSRRKKKNCVPFLKVGCSPIPFLCKPSGIHCEDGTQISWCHLWQKNILCHIKELETECIGALNILKVIAYRYWGTYYKAPHHVYTCVVRAKLVHGCIVYRSSWHSILKCIDPVHCQALRLILRVFQTSPVQSWYVQCNKWSLWRRQAYLGGSVHTKNL